MLKALFTCLAISLHVISIAQLGERDSRGKTYGERDMEKTADRTRAGNTPLYSNKPQNGKPLSESELTNLWRSASGKKDASNTAEANQERFRAFEKEVAAERQANLNEQLDILRKSANVRDALLKAGFANGTEENGEWLEATANGNDATKEKLNALLANMIANKNAFNANKATAGPLQSLHYISGYLPAWKTSLGDLKWMEEKCPEYKGKIDTLRLYALGYYYGMETPYGQISNGSGRPSPNEDIYGYIRVTENEFVPLAEQYPELALLIAGQASHSFSGQSRNPFVQLSALYTRRAMQLEKKQAKENAALQEKATSFLKKALHVKRPAGMTPLSLKWQPTLDEADKMLAALTVSEWKDICAGLNEDFGTLMENMSGYGGIYPRLIYGRMEYDRYVKGKSGSKSNKPFVLSDAIEKMATAGDPEAQNLQGVFLLQYARKFNPSLSTDLFRQAAAKGSLAAQINLYLVTSLPVDYSGEDKRRKEESALINSINSADKLQLDACIPIFVELSKGGGYAKSNHEYITQDIRQAIDKNLKAAGLETMIW